MVSFKNLRLTLAYPHFGVSSMRPVSLFSAVHSWASSQQWLNHSSMLMWSDRCWRSCSSVKTILHVDLSSYPDERILYIRPWNGVSLFLFNIILNIVDLGVWLLSCASLNASLFSNTSLISSFIPDGSKDSFLFLKIYFRMISRWKFTQLTRC